MLRGGRDIPDPTNGPRRPRGRLSEDRTDPVSKELTRKLFWAITSTFPNLAKGQRISTFSWAAQLADRIIDGRQPSLPLPVDSSPSNGYTGLAEGRGGGRKRPSSSSALSPSTAARLAAFRAEQAALTARAWAWVRRDEAAPRQLPIPESVYREVTYGSSDSSSS